MSDNFNTKNYFILYFFFVSYFNCKLPFSEKFTFFSKVQNVESKRNHCGNHCLQRDVITLRELGNSDPGNPTFSGVSECNTRIMSLSLQGNTE